MIWLVKEPERIILKYYPDGSEPDWVRESFGERGEVALRSRTFIFEEEDVLEDVKRDEDAEDDFSFLFATLTKDGYFKVLGRKLGISQDVYFSQEMDVEIKIFNVPYKISVFKKISHVTTDDLYIGGMNENAIPQKEFEKLLQNFPGSYELSKYTEARLGTVLSDYFASASEAKEKYLHYMNKKPSFSGTDLQSIFKDIEVHKYKSTLKKLEDMLVNADMYSEHQWQKEILDITLLLFPKYVYVLEGAMVKDEYKNKERKLDLLLVDANGQVDLIEIKKPFGNALMSVGKYRDNHVPKRELSGSIVQIEKYIFNLSKSGPRGEKRLTEQFKDVLPSSFEIKVTNPSGLVLVGRDSDLSKEQKNDFEVVRRKYKNILDIITYDDLLERLRRIIEAWNKR